jgi:hypothetical protein
MQKLLFGFALTVTMLLAGAAFGDPKAYDLVKYRGHAGRVAIAFDFGDGYPEASEVRVTESGKRTIFRLDDADAMRFVPANHKENDRDDAEVVLKMRLDDAAPDKVSGSYRSHGKTVNFTLTRH